MSLIVFYLRSCVCIPALPGPLLTNAGNIYAKQILFVVIISGMKLVNMPLENIVGCADFQQYPKGPGIQVGHMFSSQEVTRVMYNFDSDRNGLSQ